MEGKTLSLEKFNSPDFLARLRNGEDAAFRELAEELNPWFINFVRKKFRLGLEDAQDIVQDVILSIYQKMLTFDPGKGKFLNRAFQILRNRCLDWLRMRNKLPTKRWNEVVAGKVLAVEEKDL